MSRPSPETLLAAFEAVEEIVGLGRYHDSPEAMARLAGLPAGLTPTPYESLTLYRALRLTVEDYAGLQGPGLHLVETPVSSWTRCRTAARMILRGRLARSGTHRGIIIKRTWPSRHLLVDVPALYRDLQFDDPSVESWDLYARWEREVLMRDLPAVTLGRADIVDEADPEDPESYRPYPDERVWIPGAEVMDTILEVDVHGIDADGIRHWAVVTDADRTGMAFYDARHHDWTMSQTVPY